MPVSEADKIFLCYRKYLVATRANEFLYQIMITSIIGHVSFCTKFLKYLNDLFLEQKFLISCWSLFVMLNHSSTPWHGHLFWKDSIPKMHYKLGSTVSFEQVCLQSPIKVVFSWGSKNWLFRFSNKRYIRIRQIKHVKRFYVGFTMVTLWPLPMGGSIKWIIQTQTNER